MSQKQIQIGAGDPNSQARHFVIEAEDDPAGRLFFEITTPANPAYESQKHLAFVSLRVLEPFRRRGIGTQALGEILRLMDENQRTLLTIDTETDEGIAFLDHAGAERKFQGAENRLDLNELDWEMVERWIAEGPVRAPGTRLEFYEHRIPEANKAEFCEVVTTLLRDVPLEGLDIGELIMTPNQLDQYYLRHDADGTSHHTYMTREPDGSVSGETDILYQPFRPTKIVQLLTGVMPEHRGKGLGKWLKAAMLDYVRKTYPEARWVATENANSNEPMLAINYALGFKEYRGGTGYQMPVDRLREHLNKA